MLPTRTSTGSSRSLANAAEAQTLRALESMRVLLLTMTVFAVVSFPILFVLPAGTDVDRALAAAGMAIVASCSLLTYVRTGRDEKAMFDPTTRVTTLLVGLSVPLLTAGLGMCTALTGVFALGLLIFATNAPLGLFVAVCIEFVVGHAVLGGLAYLDVISTTGLGDGVPTPKIEMLVSVVYVEAEYVAAAMLGRVIQRGYSAILASLEAAVRTGAHREALLREVREELDRAANLAGPGRFSGQHIDSFILDEVIGRGGMGEVYAARSVVDGREAAVKVLQRGMLSNAEMATRFAREARTVASLDAEHVTEVYEVGGLDSAVPYIAMERLRGEDLASVLRERGALPVSEVLELVRQVGAGLATAHQAGIVHRDLKPHNLFHAERNGRRLWKILDFGIAKHEADDSSLTRDQAIGTPQYMAPEQASGDGVVDRRADIHALAAIAFRALTGRQLWPYPDPARALVAVATEAPPDPRSFVAMSDDLSFVLRIGLAKRPADRFASVAELVEAFEAASNASLSSAWREHAKALLVREPWGAPVPRRADRAGADA